MRVTIGPYPKGDEERLEEISIDAYDAWSADCTLASIIAPVLETLRNNLNGFPMELTQENDDDGEKGVEAWQELLDKMIWSFKQIGTDWEEQFMSGELVFPPKESTFKIDSDGIKEYEERIQEGLDLFAKYYRHLWD